MTSKERILEAKHATLEAKVYSERAQPLTFLSSPSNSLLGPQTPHAKADYWQVSELDKHVDPRAAAARKDAKGDLNAQVCTRNPTPLHPYTLHPCVRTPHAASTVRSPSTLQTSPSLLLSSLELSHTPSL